MIVAGSLFSFSVISFGLREKFNYSLTDVNLISAIGNTALYVSFMIIGPLYDQFGTRFTMVMGSATYGCGYLLMWLSLKGQFGPDVPPLSMAFFYFLAGYGSTAAYMATLGCNISNFKEKYTGLVTAVLLGCYGLSGTIFSQIYSIFYTYGTDAENVEGFLMFLFISTSVVNFVCTFLIFPLHASDKTAALGTKDKTEQQIAHEIGIKASRVNVNDDDYDIPLIDQSNPGTKYTQLEDITVDTEAKKPVVAPASIPTEPTIVEKKSFTPFQILASPLFWTFTLIYILQQGLVYISNVTTIYRSVEGPGADPISISKIGADHITLMSIAQSGSRFLFAILSDIIGERLHLDRSFLLIIAEFFLLLPMMALAIASEDPKVNGDIMWMSSLFIGIGWGAGGALFPPLTKDFFGMKYYGTACGLVMTGVPIGILFSNQIFGIFYDMELEHTGATGNICYGRACFQSSFLVSSGLQAMAFVLAILLFRFRRS